MLVFINLQYLIFSQFLTILNINNNVNYLWMYSNFNEFIVENIGVVESNLHIKNIPLLFFSAFVNLLRKEGYVHAHIDTQ